MEIDEQQPITRRQWLTLIGVVFGLFMIMLDNTIVSVALPSIRADLDVGLSELEWIVTGYTLTFASMMLIGGKLGDAYGRRKAFVTGMGIFAVASLFCGLADSGTALIGWRVVQGVGAALMNPASLSIIVATFPPKRRGTAIGIWAGSSALALVIAPMAGGIIAENFHWGWIFLINVPVAVVGIVVAFLFIDESRDETHQRLDLPGLVTSALALFAFSYGLIEANTYGWGSARILLVFAVAVLSFIAFIWLERVQRNPMLDLGLFANKAYAAANGIMLCIGLGMFGLLFFVSIYLQTVLGYSPIEAGAAFLPVTITIVLLAPLAGRLADKIGARVLIVPGTILLAIQLIWLSFMDANASYWAILPSFVIGGIGLALSMTPTTSAAMLYVPVDKAGVGSAVLNSARQVGGSLGIAVMGAVIAASGGIAEGPASFLDGFHHAVLVAAGSCLLGSLGAFVYLRGRPPRQGVVQPALDTAGEPAAASSAR